MLNGDQFAALPSFDMSMAGTLDQLRLSVDELLERESKLDVLASLRYLKAAEYIIDTSYHTPATTARPP